MPSPYPPPLIIPPRSLPHKQTFILLHGRGSSGEKFGPVLLDTPILSATASGQLSNTTNTSRLPSTLATAFPHARFVFPTAARRRAIIYRRAYTHQRFNNWTLDPPATDREELQAPGLHETISFLHDLLRAEIAAVPGAANVVLGGLSQGCAASLVASLLWQGDALAAMVGMCGWLPYRMRLDDQMSVDEVEDGENLDSDDKADSGQVFFDPFRTEGAPTISRSKLGRPALAVNWLREELEYPSSSTVLPFQGTPIFLGHGKEDDRVSVILGRDASTCLENMGIEVCWNEYEALGHWYSGNMLRDMVDFICTKTNWE